MENDNIPILGASAQAPDYTYEILNTTSKIIDAIARTGQRSIDDIVADIPRIFGAVKGAIEGGGRPLNVETPAPQVERPSAAKIRSSVGQDAIVSFEDGKRYKSLKRHLTARGLTPVEYRTKWGLPMDYPMVAPAYAAVRSELAKASGLGRKANPFENDPNPAQVAAETPTPEAPKAKRKTTRKPKLTTVPDGDVAGTMPDAEDVTGGSTDQGFGDAPQGQTAEAILAEQILAS